MAQYINKSAVEAEIKTRIETYNKGYANGDDCRADALETFLHDIDSLEVKEVDLEEELKTLDNTLFDLDGVAVQGATHYLTVEDVKDIAKYFFELGLKVKGE